jgi:hypothetical protein
MPKVSWSKPLWDPMPRAVQRRMHVEAQAQQYNDPRWNWARRRHVRRALIATYLVTLVALATVGWIDALRSGQREGLTGVLWLAFFVAILVEQALLDKATCGLFKLRVGELDERQRAIRDLGYRYGFRILAVAATIILAVALYLPVDRFLDATNRVQWIAIAIAVVYLVWRLPTMVVAWITPDTQPQGGGGGGGGGAPRAWVGGGVMGQAEANRACACVSSWSLNSSGNLPSGRATDG